MRPRFKVTLKQPKSFVDKTLSRTNENIQRINTRYLHNDGILAHKRNYYIRLNDKLSRSVDDKSTEDSQNQSNKVKVPGNEKYSKLLHKYHLQLTRNKKLLRELSMKTLPKPKESPKLGSEIEHAGVQSAQKPKQPVFSKFDKSTH